MTPATLQALRRLLFFSIEEAALLVGRASARSWQYWERGERSIPGDVSKTVLALVRWRDQALAATRKQIAAMPPGAKLALVWYNTLDDWATVEGREPEYWRPQCSVLAEVAAEFNAALIRFDAPAYRAWLGNRKDTEAMRGAWAASL